MLRVKFIAPSYKLQAQGDDDEMVDDMAVNMDGGKMDEFFQEVEEIRDRARSAEALGFASAWVPYLPWWLDALASIRRAVRAQPTRRSLNETHGDIAKEAWKRSGEALTAESSFSSR